jgi:hypothetical protein
MGRRLTIALPSTLTPFLWMGRTKLLHILRWLIEISHLIQFNQTRLIGNFGRCFSHDFILRLIRERETHPLNFFQGDITPHHFRQTVQQILHRHCNERTRQHIHG